MPPPTTTTRARLGSSAIRGHVVEQTVEVRTVEGRLRPVVLLHRPLPEVEVERAHRVLDRAPESPAVLGDQPPEPRAGDPVPVQHAVVGLDELVELVERQTGLAPDVAELEGGLVVAGVLVVDQPDPLP